MKKDELILRLQIIYQLKLIMKEEFMDWCEFSLCIWMSAAFIDGNQIFELYFETYKTLKNIINKNVFHEFLKYVKLKKFFQSIWKGNIYKGFQDQFCPQNNQLFQGKPMVK